MTRAHDEPTPESAYSGRWVARVQGTIIGHGGTPRLALLAAQTNRHKERPNISFIPPESPLRLSPLIGRVGAVLSDQELYLVGGALRDALLGRISHDFDFALRGNAIGLARRVAAALQADFYVLGESFDAARVILSNPSGPRDVLDFSSFRGADLELDLAGRDFTVNAMAFDLHNWTLSDPLNGAADLRAKVIRICSDSAIDDDPIRVLRGVRLAAALDFTIESTSRRAMKRGARLLPGVSPERQRDELFRVLEGPRPSASLKALEILGAIAFILPELSRLKGTEQAAPHVYDVWDHTLSVIGHLDGIMATLDSDHAGEKNDEVFTGLLSLRLGRFRPQFRAHLAKALTPERSLRALLFFAALYHDVSKPATRTVDEGGRFHFFEHEIEGSTVAADRGRGLNLSNSEVSRLKLLVASHLRFNDHVTRMKNGPQMPSRQAIYRFYRDVGEGGVDLVLLGLADLRGKHGHSLSQDVWSAALEVARALLESYWEKPEDAVDPPRLVNGNDIMQECGIGPGPLVGEVLEVIREAQATGLVSTRGEALVFGQDWIRGQQE